MRAQISWVLQIVGTKVVDVVAHRADETLAVRIPKMMGVRSHAIRTLFEVHRRLPRDLANVVSILDVQQQNCLTKVSEQRELSIRRQRGIVAGTDAVEMLDVELAFGPIKPQDAGAADEAIQIWSIQCVVNAKGLVSHRDSFFDSRGMSCRRRLRDQIDRNLRRFQSLRALA